MEILIGIMIGLFFLSILVLIYFLPSTIANGRGHPRRETITFINIFFGWTVIGWLVALIWAQRDSFSDALRANVGANQWTRCPKCGIRFKVPGKAAFMRHARCGQALELVRVG